MTVSEHVGGQKNQSSLVHRSATSFAPFSGPQSSSRFASCTYSAPCLVVVVVASSSRRRHRRARRRRVVVVQNWGCRGLGATFGVTFGKRGSGVTLGVTRLWDHVGGKEVTRLWGNVGGNGNIFKPAMRHAHFF